MVSIIYTENAVIIEVIELDPIGVKDSEGITDLTVYPNPSANFITLEGLTTTEMITIYSSLGYKIKTVELTPSQNRISTDELESGVYFISLSDIQYRFSKE